MPHEHSPCTLTVRFEVDPADFAGFLAEVTENARFSVAIEPGCLRFDVLVPEAGAGPVLLYEIYATAEDFDLHLAADHYLRFDAATKAMVRGKTVTFHRIREHAKHPSLP